MAQLVAPDLAQETLSEIDAALARVRIDSEQTKTMTPEKRRRVREFLSPQANGDQDAW
jgi:hypothetical protein